MKKNKRDYLEQYWFVMGTIKGSEYFNSHKKLFRTDSYEKIAKIAQDAIDDIESSVEWVNIRQKMLSQVDTSGRRRFVNNEEIMQLYNEIALNAELDNYDRNPYDNIDIFNGEIYNDYTSDYQSLFDLLTTEFEKGFFEGLRQRIREIR